MQEKFTQTTKALVYPGTVQNKTIFLYSIHYAVLPC